MTCVPLRNYKSWKRAQTNQTLTKETKLPVYVCIQINTNLQGLNLTQHIAGFIIRYWTRFVIRLVNRYVLGYAADLSTNFS